MNIVETLSEVMGFDTRHKQVFKSRVYNILGIGNNDLTLEQIAGLLDVCPERVRQMEFGIGKQVDAFLKAKVALKPLIDRPAMKPLSEYELEELLKINIFRAFKMSVRLVNCFKNNMRDHRKMEVETIGDLLKYKKSEYMSVRNFGKISMLELEELLRPLGLELKE